MLVTMLRPWGVCVGLPTLLRSQRYHRNQLLFNMCFVLRPGAPTQPFEPLLRKVVFAQFQNNNTNTSTGCTA
jgi:hypothetical protein